MRSASYFISRKQYSAGSALQTGLYKGVTARKNILKLVLRFSTNGKLVLCIAMTSSWATYNNKIALLLLFSFLSFSMWCHLKAHFLQEPYHIRTQICVLHIQAYCVYYRQLEKRNEYQTLVLNDWPFGNELAVSFFRRRARLRSRAYNFRYSIEKRSGKIGGDVSFNGNHVLY